MGNIRKRVTRVASEFHVTEGGDMGMSEAAKKEYAESIKARYFKANREEKGFILQEFCAVTGYHRKSALRMLRTKINELARDTPKPKGIRGRKSKYREDKEFMAALQGIWSEAFLWGHPLSNFV